LKHPLNASAAQQRPFCWCCRFADHTHPYHILISLKRAARRIGTTTFLPQQARGKVFHFTARPLEQQTSGQILLEESLKPQQGFNTVSGETAPYIIVIQGLNPPNATDFRRMV